jgi:hypothetical protein
MTVSPGLPFIFSDFRAVIQSLKRPFLSKVLVVVVVAASSRRFREQVATATNWEQRRMKRAGGTICVDFAFRFVSS